MTAELRARIRGARGRKSGLKTCRTVRPRNAYRYETTDGICANARIYLYLCARSARTFRTRENLARTHAANAALAGSGAAAATAAEAAKYGPGS